LTNPVQLYVLDVGHGNCAVLVDTRGVVVIDTGRGDGLRQFLNQHSIHAVSLVLLSHADIDHIGGLVHLVASREIQIDRVVVNSDALKDTEAWEDLRYELASSQDMGELSFEIGLSRRDTDEYDQGEVHIEIIGPTGYLAGAGPGGRDRLGRPITSNSVSALIRLSRKGRAIALFTGDLDEIGLDDLVSRGIDMKAPVLVFPHHGGGVGGGDNTAFGTSIARAVSPTRVIFSIGRGAYGTPRPEIVAAVRNASPTVWVACTQLSEHCARMLSSRDPKHLGQEFAQGRERRKCCAGTITIRIDDSDAVSPSREHHLAFIRNNAPTALCQSTIPSGGSASVTHSQV